MNLGHIDRRIGAVPGGQKANGRREERTLLGHKVHGALIDIKTVNQLLATKSHRVIRSRMRIVAMAPNGNAHHLRLVDYRLDFLGTIMLSATGVPTPDTAAGSPNLDGIGVLAQALPNSTAQLPRPIHLIAPRMRLLILELAAAVRIAMSRSAAKAQARRIDARALEHAVIDAIAHVDTKPPHFAHSGKAMGQAVVCLFDGDRLLFQQRLHDPIGIVIGQVAREMQMRIDQTRHDSFSSGVDANVAAIGGHVLVFARMLDPAILPNKDESIFNRCRTGTVNEFSSDNRIFLTHDSSSGTVIESCPIRTQQRRQGRHAHVYSWQLP